MPGMPYGVQIGCLTVGCETEVESRRLRRVARAAETRLGRILDAQEALRLTEYSKRGVGISADLIARKWIDAGRP